MKCVSVKQPWAWAILHAGKDVENRTWVPKLTPGARLAIHASKQFDAEGLRWIRAAHEALGLNLEDIPINPKAYPVGCVVGSVEFVGAVENDRRFPRMAPAPSDSKWFFGPVGWLVQDPKPLAAPVPMKGMLKLFEVDDGIFSQNETKESPMAKKKKTEVTDEQSAEQQAPAASRFVDVVVEEREVPVRLSDERLLEIADEACSKHRAAWELHVEIKVYSDSRKALIKTLDDEAAELDEQFYRKTVPATKEVRIIKDFAKGRLRVEVVETGEVVEDREFGASECQRDFASMLESDPSDQFLQRAVDVIRQHLEQQTDPQEFADIVAETLGVSVSFGERILGLLKGKVLVGEGTETDPMTIVDVSRKCEDCRNYPELDNRPECGECECEDGLPGFEKLDKCSGCQFRRNLMTFKPCAGCDPAGAAEGFVSLVD